MSSQAELEESELQLVQINQALKDSPDDSELLALKAELENLVQLTKDYLKSQAGGAAGSGAGSAGGSRGASTSAQGGASGSGGSSKDAASFTTGTDVLAKWHGDGRFYPARIMSVSGSTADPVYTVIFEIDKSTEVVRRGDVKALSESKKRALQYSNQERDSDGAASDSAGASKKPKTAAEKAEKKAGKEVERKARVAEQNNRQTSWQSFAKKATKKGTKIAGVSGESMFKTPDNPYGRVGVTGSGKGMTSYAAKQRVKFTEGDEEAT